MNSTECPFLFALSYLGAKIVQIEQKTKFYLSFFEMQPIFDLLRSEINISPQTAKDLREKFYCLALAMIASGIPTVYSTPSILRSASMWL